MAATKANVIELIDRHPVTGFQIGVLILCMLVAALDGFDTQAIGYTAPAIAAVIHLPMPQFGQSVLLDYRAPRSALCRSGRSPIFSAANGS